MGVFDIFKSTAKDTKINMMEDGNSNGSNLVSSNSNTVSVDEDTAMKIAALHQGINIIADTIAAMPVYLHKENDGFQQTLYEDPRCNILSGMANEVLTSFNLKKILIKDMILYGNSYAKIDRKGDDIKLYYLPKEIVTPKKDKSGYYFEVQSYTTDVMGENNPSEIVDDSDMICLIRNPKYNSITGQGLLDYAADLIKMSTYETNYMTNLFQNGLSAKAVLSSKTPFKKEVKEQLKADLKEFYSGVNNAGKMMVLEGEVSVLPLSLTPSDIKLIENKNFTITEIARFLGIQKHMLNLDRGQGTYSNITQERLMLLQNTLTPYVVAIEEALNQKLLTEDEIKQNFYFQFNTSEMLKLTPEDQANYMLNLYRENVVTLEEVRAALNLGGDIDTINELKSYQDMRVKQYSKGLDKNKEVVEEEPKEVEEETKEETPNQEEKSE